MTTTPAPVYVFVTAENEAEAFDNLAVLFAYDPDAKMVHCEPAQEPEESPTFVFLTKDFLGDATGDEMLHDHFDLPECENHPVIFAD